MKEREKRKSGQMAFIPKSWVSLIILGSVDGSRTNCTHLLGSEARAIKTASLRGGKGSNFSIPWATVEARDSWRAGHWPERRWIISPGKEPHPGREQHPDSPVHLDRRQSDLYFPLSSRAWMMAALTAEGELRQDVHIGCGPCPRRRKSVLRNWRLGSFLNSSDNLI